MTVLSTSNAWIRRLLAAFVLVAFMPLATTGCFGKFQMTRNVYKFNKEVSPDKWIQWFVMLVLGIIPIYGLAAMIDLVVANSIEFWTDENPIKPSADAGTTKVVRGPHGEVLTMTHLADDRIEVSIGGFDRAEDRFYLSREADSVAAYDARGALIARVGDVQGAPGLLEASPAR